MKNFFSNMMLRAMVICLSVFAFNSSQAQVVDDSTYVDAVVESYTPNYDKVLPSFEQYIEQNCLAINLKVKDVWEERCEVIMTMEKFLTLKKLLDEWKCQTITLNEKTRYIRTEKAPKLDEIRSLRREIKDRQKVMDTLRSQSARAALLRANDDDEIRIGKYEEEIKKIEMKLNTILLTVTLKREMTTPRGNHRVRFVNMPGVEYSYLKPENPKPGFSAESYRGYNLKYVFTEGKSHLTVGVFKADGIKADSSTYSDIFNFSFGQDFYSRHFGRGCRQFFNVYSGYNIGFLAYNSEKKTLKNIYISPSVGVEIYKNNWMLLETNVNYMLPFSHNYELRGLQVAVSLNFSL